MLTRIGASSTANARVNPSIAEQVLDATDQPLPGRAPATPEVKTMDPPGRSLPCGAFAAARAPQYLSSKKLRAVEMSIAFNGTICRASPAV